MGRQRLYPPIWIQLVFPALFIGLMLATSCAERKPEYDRTMIEANAARTGRASIEPVAMANRSSEASDRSDGRDRGNPESGDTAIAATSRSAVSGPQENATGRGTPAPAGKDLTDVLLLTDSRRPAFPSEALYRKVVDFYGLKLAEIDLASNSLTDALLRDEMGNYYSAVYAVAATLESSLDSQEMQTLANAIENGGLNLMIGTLQTAPSRSARSLTNNAILGSTSRADSQKDYRVSVDRPEITRQLSGIKVVHPSAQADYALSLASTSEGLDTLVTSTDDNGQEYAVFARVVYGHGQVFVSSIAEDDIVDSAPLRDLYYPLAQPDGTFRARRFGQIVPMMMFIRYSAGDEAWHNDHHYANLTIDDPALRYSQLDYVALLKQAIAHNWHLTVAMPPYEFMRTQAEIATLFLANPDRLSIAQHGNNHDDYEFYKYETKPGDSHPARPIVQQEANIVEGRTRMEAHWQLTRVPYAPVMIFPYGISPSPTLALLKQYNYLATVNADEVPLGETLDGKGPNVLMYPAELSYANFATVQRHLPPELVAPFDLFIDKPVFAFEHKGLFEARPEGFNQYADAINRLPGGCEWRALDYIIKRMYLEKRNDDQSIDVMFFGNEVVVSNATTETLTYHLKRHEDGKVGLMAVTLDGSPVEYSLVGNTLQVDTTILPGQSRQLRVQYGSPERDFALAQEDVTLDLASSVLTVVVHNRGKKGGPVPLGFYRESSETAQNLLGITTAERVEPGASVSVRFTLTGLPPKRVVIVADPYNIIPETDKTNNSVSFLVPYK